MEGREVASASAETVDALLASELNNMTVADRTNVFEVGLFFFLFAFITDILLCHASFFLFFFNSSPSH